MIGKSEVRRQMGDVGEGDGERGRRGIEGGKRRVRVRMRQETEDLCKDCQLQLITGLPHATASDGTFAA
jgi:hypothetical protein